MPRGTRAIHGNEVTGQHHSQPHADLEMVQAAYDYLPTLCHCEGRIVIVAQRDVGRGITYSCGEDGCRPAHRDDDDPVIIGCSLPLHASYAEGYTVEQAAKRFGDDLRVRRDHLRARAKVQKRRREPRQATNERRNAVRLLHEIGHRSVIIAQRLGIDDATVARDLAVLRRRGIIAPGEHGGRREGAGLKQPSRRRARPETT